MKRTKTQSISERNQWIHEFENLYILTYKSLYRHGQADFWIRKIKRGTPNSGVYGGVSARGTASEREESTGLAAEAFRFSCRDPH